jgi:major type 1 subunit fimbrin (pilin)
MYRKGNDMSFNKSAVCLTLVMAGFASSAMADSAYDTSNGTVDFTGSITNTPCAISASNQNLKVDLGAVKSSVFTKKGDTSTAQPFSIVLSNCTVDRTTPFEATVSFNGAGADTAKTSLAVNAGSDTTGQAIATGVGIQILDNTQTGLPLNTDTTAIKITETEMILPYSARYISIADSVTAGLANGHTDFTVTYN